MRKLKMYKFDSGVITWVCAYSKLGAIGIYSGIVGADVYDDEKECHGDDLVTELKGDDVMTYYHDGVTPDKGTMDYLLKKYCTKPDVFACSEF